MARLAWFSPMAPARTGVAAYSAEAVVGLRSDHQIDIFADEPSARAPIHSAHDFLWKNHLAPYDLTVFQLGNSSAHDFLWPYLFRFPGLAVLHDAHLHHARAASLLRAQRAADYRAEFAAAHPAVSSDMAELAVKGFDSYLYYNWPMTRLVVDASRLTAIHAGPAVERIREASPAAPLEIIRLGHGERITAEHAAAARREVGSKYGIPEEAVLFGVFGGLAPEKRLPQILRAFAALRSHEPSVRLLLAGAPARHYDIAESVRALGIGEAVSSAGYLEDEHAFTAAIAACDVSINLRWPTAREVSGPWVRALAAGKPTIITDLAHTADVPALDPRNWLVSHASPDLNVVPDPVAVAIDILDEDHSLRLAMRRLTSDAGLRTRLGRAAAEYWQQAHSTAGMIADYNRVIARARTLPAPVVELPSHLRDDGSWKLRELLEPFGAAGGDDLWSTI